MRRRLDETARRAVANILMEAIDEIARASRIYSGGISMAEAAHYWAQAVFNAMQGRNGANSGYQSKGFVAFKGPKSKREELYSAIDWHWTLCNEFMENLNLVLGSMYKYAGKQVATMSDLTKAQKATVAKLGPKGTVDLPPSMHKPSKYLPLSKEAMRDILISFFTLKEFEGLEFNAIRIVRAYINRHKENVPGFDANNPDFNGEEVLKQIMSALKMFTMHTIKGNKDMRVSHSAKTIRLDQMTNGKGEDDLTGRAIANSTLKSIGGTDENGMFKGRDDDAMNPEINLPFSEEELNNLDAGTEKIDDLGDMDKMDALDKSDPIYVINKLKRLLEFVASGNSGHLSGFYETTPKSGGTIFKPFLIHAARYISDHFDNILTPERLEQVRQTATSMEYSTKALKTMFTTWCNDAVRDECYRAIDSDDLGNDILKTFPGVLKGLMNKYNTPEYPAQKEEAKKKIGENITTQMAVFWNNLNPDEKDVGDKENKRTSKPLRIGQEAIRVINGAEPTYTGKFDKTESDKFLANNPSEFRKLDPSISDDSIAKLQDKFGNEEENGDGKDDGKKEKKKSKVSEMLVRSIRSAVREAVRRQLRNMI